MTLTAAKLEEMEKVNLEIDSMIASGDDITAIAYREKNLKSNLFNHRTELLELAKIGEKFKRMVAETKPLDPEFSRIIDKHFWDLVM